MRIAMIGTRGVPARYSGFETAVEEVGVRLAAKGHEVVVWCRGELVGDTYRGMQLVHAPCVKSKSLETLSHTAATTWQMLFRKKFDAVIMFNAANAIFLPVVKRRTRGVAVHVDGLEWKRSKWGPMGKSWYRNMERASVKLANAVIADAEAIEDYYRERFGRESFFIPYGAPILDDSHAERLAELDLKPQGYHLVVARFEPENHVDLAIAGYRASKAELPLVLVGSVPYPSEHSAAIDAAVVEAGPSVRQLGGIWDQELLDALYANSLSYTHGHSVGGTNPSLLRAMGAGANVLAYDVHFNREVLGETGRFWADPAELALRYEETEADPSLAGKLGDAAKVRASERYVWDDVADKYEKLCEFLAAKKRL